MAEQPDRKQQNQAFLQELERQRLNKPCNRVIDLRGKVAGECQAYQFGERTHYLDDRAYLLARQLMARFDGRYTIGVYETVLKALKKLAQSDPPPPPTHSGPQLIQVDEALQRSGQRVVFSTPVRLRLEDVLYNGNTVDIASRAIRVALKRSYSLHLGDRVLVEFVDFYQQTSLPFLQQLPFDIIKLDHDATYTTIVLSRTDNSDQAANDWLEQWVTQHAGSRQLDIDNELINLVSQIYLRLWLRKLSAPLLWLADSSDMQPPLALHMMPTAAAIFEPWQQTKQTTLLEKLPLSLLKQQTAVLAVIDKEQSHAAPLGQTSTINKLILWHLQHPGSQLLLLKAHALEFNPRDFSHEVTTIAAVDSEQAKNLQHRLTQLQQKVSIIDLTALTANIAPGPTINSRQISTFQTLKTFFDKEPPLPKPLHQPIQRDAVRFYIRTPITLHIGDKHYQLETLDVSAGGLALKIPITEKLELNKRVLIDFDRWQTLTKKVKLQDIPYQIKNKLVWNGEIRLGLQRIKNNCPASLNSFFDWVIAQNKSALKPNNDDVIDAAESRVFSELLTPTLDSTGLFFGLDNNGHRHLETIAATRVNQARTLDDSFWQAISHELTRLSEIIKNLPADDSAHHTTGLYAYQNTNGNWTTALETDFHHSREKAVFMQRALAAADFRIYLCVLMPFSAKDSEAEKNLSAQLMQMRQQRAHRVKQIRQQLTNLFGMAELTDVSDIFKLLYQT
ncbi:PilZ domain-containing protein [Methylophaga sp. OBS4]|uniref:PilZ domain-containing protein n=1 Tax=Methylophaga sp. OBS4 TaxID=2991935 RepID=UPI00224E921D|nr:PilZ domain-containing protein [Methylophaga sp. OBS4]MCX4187640.1 PilZ domain-containing protein [Methylophaga sp. OBS4]